MTPKQLIRRYKTQSKAAEELGYTRATISLWVKNDRIPRHAQKYIRAITGMKVEWEK